MTQANDEADIRGLIDTFVAGWNAASGEQLSAAFHEDADFMAITGLRAHGREVIARGHDEILSTIYRGVSQSAQINSLRFLRPDVAVCDATMTLGENAPFGVRQALLSAVVTREAGRWGVAVFRNMVPHGRPNAGPLEDSLKPPAR